MGGYMGIKWRELGIDYKNPIHRAYMQHHGDAKKRGIPFKLTLTEWLDIWGDKLPMRGKGKGKFHMCRKNDIGAYEVGNVYIGEHCYNSVKYHHTAVLVNGKKYLSTGQASRDLDIRDDTIRYRIQAGWQGYKWI